MIFACLKDLIEGILKWGLTYCFQMQKYFYYAKRINLLIDIELIRQKWNG